MLGENRVAANIILAVGVAAAGYFIGQGTKFIKKFDQAVEVKGLAERVVKSTDAVWHIDYTITGDAVAQINADAAKAQDTLHKFLISKAFVDTEIQKMPLQIRDRYAEEQGHKGPQFTARGGCIVASKKVDQVTSAAEQTDELLKAGVLVGSSGVNYYFSELNAIKPEMLKEAVGNAREAASSFAEHSHARLGKIKSASQGLFSIGAPFTEYDTGTSLMKKVRVVTQVSYFLD